MRKLFEIFIAVFVKTVAFSAYIYKKGTRVYFIIERKKRRTGVCMYYVKKMCIVRQLRQGFSGDGRPLSGLVKAEQYGKNLAVEIAVVNLAPLTAGEYFCVLADKKGSTEVLVLGEDARFNFVSALDISAGFCALLCFVKTDVLPIAYAVNGEIPVDTQKLVETALLRRKKELPETETATTEETEEAATDESYDDEAITVEDYFEREEEDERETDTKIDGDAHVESGITGTGAQTGDDAETHEDGEGVLHAFTTDSDGYYQSVKGEIDALFENYPKDDTLVGAYRSSEWVRVKGEEGDPKQLVGIVYEDGKPQYICYALPAESETPPEEIAGSCFFVPVSPYEKRGFFVLYQSTATGECIKPKEV